MRYNRANTWLNTRIWNRRKLRLLQA